MKVTELQRQLDEGFLDNFISKVKSMAGGDGPTGIIRALGNNNAALNKFADAIVNVARPRINQRLGNSINAIQSGSSRMPIQTIYKQAMAAAPTVAGKDGIKIEADAVRQVIKNNRSDVLRMVLNGDAGEDDVVRKTYDAVMSNTPEADLGNNVDAVTKTVGLIIASAVVYIQTQQQDASDAGSTVDKSLVDNFNKFGLELTKALATKESPLLRELKANDLYKDRVESLIVNIARTVREKYLNLEASQLANLVTSTPELVSLTAVKNAVGSHASDLDPTKVNDYAQRIHGAIQRLFAKWLAIANTENTPGRPESLEAMRYWAADLLNNYLDVLDTSSAPSTSAETDVDNATVDKVSAQVKNLSPEEKIELLANNPDLVATALKNLSKT